MRLLIVGVGQTLNFETREMEDVLQVMTPDGSVFSVPTTNEAAQGYYRLRVALPEAFAFLRRVLTTIEKEG